MLIVRSILQSKNLCLVWQMILVALSCCVVLWSHSVLMFFVEIVSSAECADIWYKLKKDDKEKHIHVMKVYLLSPFLFGIVHQDDKVNKFIPKKIHCKISLISIHFQNSLLASKTVNFELILFVTNLTWKRITSQNSKMHALSRLCLVTLGSDL